MLMKAYSRRGVYDRRIEGDPLGGGGWAGAGVPASEILDSTCEPHPVWQMRNPSELVLRNTVT